MTTSPRGYALLIVLLSVAVATGLLVRNLAVRPTSESVPSSLALWHDAHAVLTRCIEAHALRGVDAPSVVVNQPSGQIERVPVSGGACRLSWATGDEATVFTVRVIAPELTDVAASIVRRREQPPMLVYRR